MSGEDNLLKHDKLTSIVSRASCVGPWQLTRPIMLAVHPESHHLLKRAAAEALAIGNAQAKDADMVGGEDAQ